MISGFALASANEDLDDIHKVYCTNGPTLSHGSKCKEHDWKYTFDKEKVWAKCDTGYYLKALYRNDGNDAKHIDKGVCCKPNSADAKEYTSSECKVQYNMMGKNKISRCPAGYLLSGLRRDGNNDLNGVSTFLCCPLKE